ncbi:MAG TPA: hypothetical protein VI636_05450 [Candidatus Angelobacter sp.]
MKPIDLNNLLDWYSRETEQITIESFRYVAQYAGTHWQDFVRFAEKPLLLWQGCDRVAPEGKKQRYHTYPEQIKAIAKRLYVKLDTRPNGPARASFEIAGGERPERAGSTNDWTAHHLYSGKFPYIGRSKTTHAVKLGNHFTQSAGVITAHPIADALCDEYPFFTWLLRALSYQKFSYDPDGVFSNERDEFGFEIRQPCNVFFKLPIAASTATR